MVQSLQMMATIELTVTYSVRFDNCTRGVNEASRVAATWSSARKHKLQLAECCFTCWRTMYRILDAVCHVKYHTSIYTRVMFLSHWEATACYMLDIVFCVKTIRYILYP